MTNGAHGAATKRKEIIAMKTVQPEKTWVGWETSRKERANKEESFLERETRMETIGVTRVASRAIARAAKGIGRMAAGVIRARASGGRGMGSFKDIAVIV